jgi:hypothetical protein
MKNAPKQLDEDANREITKDTSDDQESNSQCVGKIKTIKKRPKFIRSFSTFLIQL